MKRLHVKKNKNLFKSCLIPKPKLFLNKTLWEGKVLFTEQSKYILDPTDQKDLNKGYGISGNLTNNHDISIMLGWRYNPQTDLFELTPYAHNGSLSKRIWPSDNKHNPKILKTVPVGEPVTYYISKLGPTTINFYFLGSELEDIFTVDFYKPIPKLLRQIDYWFGGNDSNNDGLGGKAPHDLSLLASFKAY